MANLFNKLAEISENLMQNVPEEKKFDVMIMTNLDFMSQTNAALQNNLSNWPHDKIREYGLRVQYYSRVNTALKQMKDEGEANHEIMGLAISSIKKALDYVFDEYSQMYEDGSEKIRKQLIEEVFLPHFLLIRFLESQSGFKNSENRQSDKLNFVFKSSDHLRYENGIHVSGPHGGAARAVKVEPQNSSPDSYTVTTFNLDGDHPIWQNNIQMAPKQMKILNRQDEKVTLRGYGSDMFGNTFSNYGITIHFKENEVFKCVLHMYDRNINIEYQK